ncbi:MAG: DUF5107 domain-containing protein, partial [Planctomycetes bacterium]|nr:DUF5107 domain-containing protein [Planctomycetota bacterium]
MESARLCRRPRWAYTHIILMICLPALLRSPAAAEPARIWEEDLVLPTYAIGEPDPNPRFYDGATTQGAQKRIYPYPAWDVLTDRREEKTYRAVRLENEYIRITVLPELGGRIFEAVDKTNGYHFFYRQHVIKPALIGMLGAWLSGGVEWNFPHHHRATTLYPMAHALRREPDGSVILWIGETERRHGMRFDVSMTVRPGSSRLEVAVEPYNRTGLVSSFLYFANPAVHVDETYQVMFPPNVQYVTQHAKREFATWPVANGRYGG